MDRETDFQRLVDQHYSSLYRFALSLTRRENDASDLTQETFYIWAQKGHQIRDERKVKSWLFTTLHREYLQTHRRMVRFREIELEAAEPELPEIAPPSPERLDWSNLLGELAKLDEAFQAVLALFYLENYTYPEIAEILSIPLGTVKSRISRGILHLQKALAEPADAVPVKEVCHG